MDDSYIDDQCADYLEKKAEAEVDKAQVDFNKMYAERERLWHKLAKLFKDQGMPVSHVIFQLSVEDLITVLIGMIQEGRFDPDDPLFFPPTLVDTVTDGCEEGIEWGAVLRYAVLEYNSDLKEERRRYECGHLPSKGGAGS